MSKRKRYKLNTPQSNHGDHHHHHVPVNYGISAAHESPARSWIAMPHDTRQEINPFDREKIVEKARFLDFNYPIVSRLIEKTARHAVGSGIVLTPATDDEEWNKEWAEKFERWAINPNYYSIDGSVNFYEDQYNVARTVPRDGEYFAGLINPKKGYPCVQPYDVFEISNGYGISDPNVFDGARLNRYGRVLSWMVQGMALDYSSRASYEVRAIDMIHVYDRVRARSNRGVSWLVSAINKAIDAMDLNALTTASAKLHNTLAVSVTDGVDALPSNKSGMMRASKAAGEALGIAPPDVSQSSKEARASMQRAFGGAVVTNLGRDGKIDLLTSDRPSQNIQDFIQMCNAEICLGFGADPGAIISPEKLTGPGVRSMLEDAEALFNRVGNLVIDQHSARVYRWRTSIAINTGEIRRPRATNWDAFTTTRPKRMTIDQGREAYATIERLKAGLTSIPREMEAMGLDPYKEATSQANFLLFLKGLEIERSLNPGSLSSLLAVDETSSGGNDDPNV